MAKVLLVEDDNNLREIYEARLQAEGYEISSAQDGEQALVVAKDFKPDLIISDVMMPKISGFEMLDILRNTAGLEHTRVIMLTALGQSEDKQRADSLGADRYLVKSQVTLEDIIKAAHDILDGDGAAPAAPTPVAETTPTEEISVASAPEVTETPVAEPAATETPVVETPVAEPPVAEAPVAEAPAEVSVPEPTPETPAAEPVAVTEPVAAPEPSVPAEPVVTDPVTAPAADTTVTTVPVVDDSSAATSPDDQLLADAANSLGANDDNAPLPTDDAPAPEAEAAPVAAEDDSSAGSSKRVISPIDSPQTKPTLEELLALEESKEAGSTPTVTPSPVIDAVQAMESAPTPPAAGGVIAPSTPPTPEVSEPSTAPEAKKTGDVNPHDISL